MLFLIFDKGCSKKICNLFRIYDENDDGYVDFPEFMVRETLKPFLGFQRETEDTHKTNSD